MRKKCNILAAVTFVLSVAIFAFTFFVYHYIGPDLNILAEYQKTASQPFLALFFGVWGVLFLFASVMSLLIGKIFFDKE